MQHTMKRNRLTIRINKPSATVFAYYTNPKNTPLWWDAVTVEETSDWPIHVGTIYRSRSVSGNWSEFTVSELKENEIFELTSKDRNYHVRYTHSVISSKVVELEYLEWVDRGELEDPYRLETLEKLKTAIELL